jgi:hypothetical protein
MYVGPSEIVQRFQCIRKYNQLPNDKGQAARDLTEDEIVNGILSVMDTRPGFAGVAVICIRQLKPVRGINYSYRGASTFGEAVRLLIQHPEDLIELRVKGIENDDRGIPSYAHGSRAQITYKSNGEEKVASYVPVNSVSLFNENSEEAINYDPRLFKAPFERDYVLNRKIFQRIHNQLSQERQYSQLLNQQTAANPTIRAGI